ncbi:MAG: chromate transporter [Anaerolineae bacterium]|nr:chromate transporter [Anaerolineae bacterium]
MDWFTYLTLFLKATLTSTGGFAPLPSLHADLTARGWASDHHFAEAIAVGQVSPGPNGLWVVSLGYITAGLPGAGLAIVAIVLPPLLVLPVQRIYARIGNYPSTRAFLNGVSLAIFGIGVVVFTRIMAQYGINWAALAMVGLGLLMAFRRLPAIVIVSIAAVLGMLLF